MMNLVFIFILLIPSIVLARPEYALREKASCINCHANPIGGGHRVVFGKSYGSRKIGKPLTNEYSAFYGDFRAIYKRNEGSNLEGTTNTNGMALMSSEISGMATLTEEEEGYSTKAVASYDFSAVQSQVRNSYILFTNVNKKAMLYSILVGKSYLPFGLMTDDHRSYLRLQTKTSYNKDFEMGVTLSGTPFFALHYDLTLMNGYQNSSFNGGDETLGYNLNLNWNPEDWSFFIGASQVLHYSKARARGPSPRALSFYGGFDFRELSEDKVPVTFLSELVFAHHFNNSSNNPNLSRFVNSTTHPAYSAAISNSTSFGLAGHLKWEINKMWLLTYKHERLLLDKRYSGDAYNRDSLSLTFQFTGNSSLMAAIDKNTATKPGINRDGQLYADTDNFYLLFRTWL